MSQDLYLYIYYKKYYHNIIHILSNYKDFLKKWLVKDFNV